MSVMVRPGGAGGTPALVTKRCGGATTPVQMWMG
jgi:hypothetical protein